MEFMLGIVVFLVTITVLHFLFTLINRKANDAFDETLNGYEEINMSNLLAKQGLTAEQLLIVDAEVNSRGKNKVVLYLLWWFTGVLGGHRFYVGDIGTGIGILLLGWLTLFIWPLIDVFFIGRRLELYNSRIESDAILRVKAQ